MATTLQAQYTAATGDIAFVARVEMACLATANNLNAEDPATPNHANRMDLMKAVANNPALYAPSFARVIASQQIDQTSTDAQIQAMVSTCWNTVAGQV